MQEIIMTDDEPQNIQLAGAILASLNGLYENSEHAFGRLERG